MKLNQLYQYIFGDGAKIDVSKTPLENRDKAYKSRKKEIVEAFQSILDNPSLAKRFRSTLLSVGSHTLDEVLFSNDTGDTNQLDEKVESENKHTSTHPFTHEKQIREEYRELNQHYLFFTGEESEQTYKDFLIAFRACKIIAEFWENTNDANNQVAALNAYKILVLFGDSTSKIPNHLKNFDTYLSQHNLTSLKHPIDYALNHEIPVNREIKDLSGWRKFIRVYGANGLEQFQIAVELEKIIGRAPRSMEEAQEASARFTYARSEEYPELAIYCKKYKIPEITFNKCLTIEKRRKQKDNLPNEIINGQEFGHPGYYLVKLPIDDPRAYLLGHITKCCQSIGGHSELCVIDGITRVNNGFYVLLKAEKNAPKHGPLLSNGKINNTDYRIVGEGYAWLSSAGNMTFDSWENLTQMPSADAAIFTLLTEFAKKVTESSSNNIVQVTIGTGGRTPEAFFKSKLLTLPEIIKEGYQYQDSISQVLIHCNRKKLDKFKIGFMEKVMNFSEYPLLLNNSEFQQILNHVNGIEIIKRMEILFLISGKTHWSDLLNVDDLAKLKKITLSDRGVALIELLSLLKSENALDAKMLQFLIRFSRDYSNLSIAVQKLIVAGILNDNVSLIFEKPHYVISKLATCLVQLHEEELLQYCRQAIISHFDNANLMTSAFLKFKSAGIFHDYYQDIIDHPKYALELSIDFVMLHEFGILAEYRQLMINYIVSGNENSETAVSLIRLHQAGLLAQYSDLVHVNFKYLHHLEPSLVMLHATGIANETYFKDILDLLILLRSEDTRDLASCCIALYESGLLKNHFQMLFKKHTYADSLNAGFQILKAADMTQHIHFKEIAEVLIANPAKASIIADIILFLHEHEAAVFQENYQRVLNYINNLTAPQALLNGFQCLKEAGIFSENWRLLIESGHNAETLANGLSLLHEAGVPAENCKILIDHPARAKTIAESLVKLHSEGLLQTYRRQFTEKPHQALADGIITLYHAGILDENLALLVRFWSKADRLALYLIDLHQADILAENRKTILEMPKGRMDEFISNLLLLHQVDSLHLLHKALIDHPELANILDGVALLLKETGIPLDENYKMAIRMLAPLILTPRTPPLEEVLMPLNPRGKAAAITTVLKDIREKNNVDPNSLLKFIYNLNAPAILTTLPPSQHPVFSTTQIIRGMDQKSSMEENKKLQLLEENIEDLLLSDDETWKAFISSVRQASQLTEVRFQGFCAYQKTFHDRLNMLLFLISNTPKIEEIKIQKKMFTSLPLELQKKYVHRVTLTHTNKPIVAEPTRVLEEYSDDDKGIIIRQVSNQQFMTDDWISMINTGPRTRLLSSTFVLQGVPIALIGQVPSSSNDQWKQQSGLIYSHQTTCRFAGKSDMSTDFYYLLPEGRYSRKLDVSMQTPSGEIDFDKMYEKNKAFKKYGAKVKKSIAELRQKVLEQRQRIQSGLPTYRTTKGKLKDNNELQSVKDYGLLINNEALVEPIEENILGVYLNTETGASINQAFQIQDFLAKQGIHVGLITYHPTAKPALTVVTRDEIYKDAVLANKVAAYQLDTIIDGGRVKAFSDTKTVLSFYPHPLVQSYWKLLGKDLKSEVDLENGLLTCYLSPKDLFEKQAAHLQAWHEMDKLCRQERWLPWAAHIIPDNDNFSVLGGKNDSNILSFFKCFFGDCQVKTREMSWDCQYSIDLDLEQSQKRLAAMLGRNEPFNLLHPQATELNKDKAASLQALIQTVEVPALISPVEVPFVEANEQSVFIHFTFLNNAYRSLIASIDEFEQRQISAYYYKLCEVLDKNYLFLPYSMASLADKPTIDMIPSEKSKSLFQASSTTEEDKISQTELQATQVKYKKVLQLIHLPDFCELTLSSNGRCYILNFPPDFPSEDSERYYYQLKATLDLGDSLFDTSGKDAEGNSIDRIYVSSFRGFSNKLDRILKHFEAKEKAAAADAAAKLSTSPHRFIAENTTIKATEDKSREALTDVSQKKKPGNTEP